MGKIDVQGTLAVNRVEVDDGIVPIGLRSDLEEAGATLVSGEEFPNARPLARRVALPAEATEDFRLRVGEDAFYFYERFLGTALNNGNWFSLAVTMSLAVSQNFVQINSALTTTINTYYAIRTYRTFPVYGTFVTEATIFFQYRAFAIQQGVTVEMGFGLPPAAATNPTDGVFFRFAANGTFVAVRSYNGAEVMSDPLAIPAVGLTHKLTIRMAVGTAYFFVNDMLVATLAANLRMAKITQSGNLPLMLRVSNSGTPLTGVILAVSHVSVLVRDLGRARQWPDMLTGWGGNALQLPQGNANGQTTTYANSAAPNAITPVNATTGYTTLGGLFAINSLGSGETDYLIFAFQPGTALSSAAPLRLVRVRGIWINCVVLGAAVAATETVIQWGIGVSSTAVSLATANAAGTKAYRRHVVGYSSFQINDASGAGSRTQAIYVPFSAPLDFGPTEFCSVFAKFIRGTAVGGQVYRGGVGLAVQWE